MSSNSPGPKVRPVMAILTGWITWPPSLRQADWWETAAAKPKPEACPMRHGDEYGEAKTYCRWCGWEAENA